MTNKLIALIFIFAGAAAHADDAPITKPKPVITREEGKPMTVVWPSGNRAEVMVNLNTSIDVPVEYQVTETTCSPTAGQLFTIHFSLKADRLGLIWTQHKDASQIGKAVTIGDQKFPLSDLEIITNSSQFNSPDLVTGLVKDKFIFGDVSWIPGMEQGKPKDFTIDTWFEENMVTNSQTGISENRIVGTVSGIHVTPDGTIDSMDSGEEVGGNFGGALLLVGDVVTWIMTTPQGVCQISSKPNAGPANKIVTDYLTNLPDKYVPYTWGGDSHTRMSKENMNSLLQNKFVEYANE